MFPFLVKQGDFVIPAFSFMLMVASLVATFYAYYRAPKKGLSQVVVLDLGIIGTVAGIVGSRLFHIIVEEPTYYWNNPTHMYEIWRGGFVSYGAIILIGLSWYIYLKKKKLPVWDYLDLYAISFPLVVFCVRVGCLGAGCCYGTPTDFFIHLIFTNPASDAGHKFHGVPLHAFQVYAMINALFLFVLMHVIAKRQSFHGQLVWSFVMLYGFTRGMLEFLRGDAERGVYFNGAISTAQIMGIIGIALGATLYHYCKKHYPFPKPA